MDDLTLAATLVTESAALAAQMRSAGVTAEEKTSPSDLVTVADRAAEGHIREVLARERPGDGLLGEEGSASRGVTGRRWVADPIDGTFNYVSGLPAWCSAVALEVDGRLTSAAVRRPVTDETWVAAGGRVERNGALVGQLEDRPLAIGSVATYLHPGDLQDPVVAGVLTSVAGAAATVRISGSGTCDLADVAAGHVGLWIQYDCADWDWLPGRALVEGVGGATEIVHRDGRRWHLAGSQQSVAEAAALLRAA
jgi:myo-inositol-1(or 4)-monophosphatase